MNQVTNDELFRGITEVKEHLKEQGEDIKNIVIQTTKTNGKVIQLREDVDKHQTLLDTITGDRKYFLGALGVLIFLQGALFLLAQYYIEDVAERVINRADIDSKIESGIIQALEANYKINEEAQSK